MAFDISEHNLVPKHSKLSNEEKDKLLENLKITIRELPKIMIDDPAIEHLKPKLGDVIKIERESRTVGTTYYYRVVADR